jgi:hypothetical protein
MAPRLTASQPTLASISAETCSTKAAPPTKCVVHFEERVWVRRTLHLHEFSDDEIDAYWYSDQEFMNMREELRLAAELIHQGLLETDNTNHCRRGADSHTPLQARLRRKIKRAVIAAVLGEQELQWEEGSSDPDFIAEVSTIKSARSRAAGREMGLEYEFDAMCYR